MAKKRGRPSKRQNIESEQAVEEPIEENTLKTYLVECPGCKGCYLWTNEHFDPSRVLRGYMVDLLPEYGPTGAQWEKPFSDHAIGPAIQCPNCAAPLLGDVDKPPHFKETA